MSIKTVEIGIDDKVVIQKIFGPLIFASLRITPIFKTNHWLVERKIVKSGVWIEWCRIPGQFDDEFTDWDGTSKPPEAKELS